MPFVSGGGGGLGSVALSGAAAAGQVPSATSSSAAAWKYPPGYEFSYTEFTSTVSITATTSATATTLFTAPAYVADGATLIRIEVFIPNVVAGANASGSETIIDIYDGSTSLGAIGNANTGNSSGISVALYGIRELTPSAASHTYSVRGWRTNANGSAQGGSGGAGNFLPGYIRVVAG